MRRGQARARGQAADALRLGGRAPRPRGSRLRRPSRPGGHLPARRQPGARAGRSRGRARRAQRVRPAGRGDGRPPGAGEREPGPADRRGRAPGRRAGDRLARAGASVPARRGERGRDPAPALPLARSAPAANAAQHRAPGADGLDHPPRDGGGRLPRHSDPDPLQAHARGRARLHRPEPAPAGPLLRASAVAPDPQAAARDRRLRPLLPDRHLLPGRGSPRRPRPGDHAARRRDGVPRPGVPLRAHGADVRRGLARGDRGRARDAVRAHDARGGAGALRQRQARPSLRARDRGRDRGDAGIRVRGVRERARRPLHSGAAGLLAGRARAPRGAREGVGGEGARLPRLRRGRRRALADREVPLGGRSSRSSAASRAPRSSSPRPSPRSLRACSARCACISGGSWA